MCLYSCHVACVLSGPTVRYWGSEVSSGGACVSVADLHRLARQRAASRQAICKQKGWEDTESVARDVDGEDTEEGQRQSEEVDCSVPMETDPMDNGEKLLSVTRTIKSSLPDSVRARLPAWISQPRLVEGDIVSASAPLTSVPLPPIIICNLRSMGCTSLFPVQVIMVVSLI